MARDTFDNYLNLGNPAVKARCKTFIDRADGWHRVTFAPAKLTRTQQQNRAWWGLVIEPLARRIMEQSEEAIEPKDAREAAHDTIVKHALGVIRYTDPITGEEKEKRKETHGLSVEEFSEMWERACCLLAGIGIIVQDPDPQQQQPQRNRKVPA